MAFSQLIKSRKSIRGYLNKPLPREVIGEIIEVAQWSPSSMNTQPWYVHVITGESLDRIRRGNTYNMMAGVPAKRDFSMKEGDEGVHRQCQVGIAVQLFEAMGYPDKDFIANHVKSVREDNQTFVRYVGFDWPVLNVRLAC